MGNPGNETYHASQELPAEVRAKARHHQIRRICEKLLWSRNKPSQQISVVEIGAGWGALGRLLSADAKFQYTGFEPSASRADYCRAQGVNVHAASFVGPQSAGIVDAVIIDNVLEHVTDPVELVLDAARSLRPGGVLFVIVPNVNDIRRFHPGWRERHHWQPHCHLNYFSARHLSWLFSRVGLDCRFFGLASFGGRRDVAMLPRILADSVGLHLFGLNCYGRKTE